MSKGVRKKKTKKEKYANGNSVSAESQRRMTIQNKLQKKRRNLK